MGLTVITGRANAGKTGWLHARIREDAARGLGPLLLLPSMPDVRRARSEFAGQDVHGVRTAVLDRWIAEMWELWGDGRGLVTPGARYALAVRAIQNARPGLLGRSARHDGFRSSIVALARLVSDPGELRATSDHDAEVQSVLAAYREAVDASGLIELAEASDLLARKPPEELPALYLNRFTDLAPHQERLIVDLSERTEVLVALAWEQDHAATRALDGLVSRLRGSGSWEHRPSPEPCDELSALEHALFSASGEVTSAGRVRLLEAPDEMRESALALDVVKRSLERGVPPSRIVVTFRSAARRAECVAAAAREAGVPLHVDLRVSLPSTPYGRALLALLDAVSGRDPSRERLRAYLDSPYSGLAFDRVARLDGDWRRRRAEGGELLRLVSAAGRGARVAVEAAHRVCETDASREDWQELSDALLANAWRDRPRDAAAASRDAAACSTVMDVVSDVARVSEHLDEGLLGSVLRGTVLRVTSGDESAGVHFTEADRIRAMRYDLVILGGLNADEFSAERAPSWESSFLERSGAGEERSERLTGRLLFYSVVTRARDGLVLLRSTGEGEGGPRRPSVFWDEVTDLYPGCAGDEDALPPVFEADGGGPVATALAWSRGRRAARACPVAPYRPMRATRLEGRALERLSAAEEFSVTEIETYLSCPYRWFFTRALGLRQMDREIGVRERGSVAHEILATFYRQWRERTGRGRVAISSLAEAHEVIGAVSDAVLDRMMVSVGAREACELERVRDDVCRVIEEDTGFLDGFEVRETEFGFGSRRDAPFELGGVRLRGSIDRIDCSDAHLFVTDYKLSGSPSGNAAFGRLGLVQLPVYAAVATSLLGKECVGGVYRSLTRPRTIRGFYTDVAGDLCTWGTRTDRVDEKGMERLIEEASERVSGAAEGIRAGVIGATPSERGCVYCDARPVCRDGGERS